MTFANKKLVVAVNVHPTIPENTLVAPETRELFRKGLCVTYKGRRSTGFQGGVSGLLGDQPKYRDQTRSYWDNSQYLLAPLWVLTHTWSNDTKARKYCMTEEMCATSTFRKKDEEQGLVHIIHQVKPGVNRRIVGGTNIPFADRSQHGLRVTVPLENYPVESVSLSELANNYSAAAKALFLMDDQQLEQFISVFRDRIDDSESIGDPGYYFCDSRIIGSSNFSVGASNRMFGIANTNHSKGYKVAYGQFDEREVTYSPKEFLALKKVVLELSEGAQPDLVTEAIAALRKPIE